MRTSPGWSGSLPTAGWSSSSPKRRAKATCSARLMSWSRRNSTLYLSSSDFISAKSVASRAASARLALDNCAPILQVSGSAWIDPSDCARTKAGVVAIVMALSPSDHEDRRTRGSSCLEVTVRLHRILQFVTLVDFDADESRGHEPEHFGRQCRFLGRVRDVIRERRPCHEQRPFDRELHRFDRRDRARGCADAHEQTAALQ